MHVYLVSGDTDPGQRTVARRLVGDTNTFDFTIVGREGRAEKMVTFLKRLDAQIAGPIAVAVFGIPGEADVDELKRAFPAAVHFHVRDTPTRDVRCDFVITWRSP